jgi:hypothetical protein
LEDENGSKRRRTTRSQTKRTVPLTLNSSDDVKEALQSARNALQEELKKAEIEIESEVLNEYENEFNKTYQVRIDDNMH